MRKVHIEPEWFAKLSDDEFIQSADLRRLYKYSILTSITALIRKGHVPEPTDKVPSLLKRKRGPVYIWNVGYLRGIIKDVRDRRNASLKRIRENYEQSRV